MIANFFDLPQRITGSAKLPIAVIIHADDFIQGCILGYHMACGCLMHGIDSFLDLAAQKNAGELRIIVFQNEKSGNSKCGVLKQKIGISVDIICGSAVLVSIIRPNL